MAFKLRMKVDLCMTGMLLFVSMTLTVTLKTFLRLVLVFLLAFYYKMTLIVKTFCAFRSVGTLKSFCYYYHYY